MPAQTRNCREGGGDLPDNMQLSQDPAEADLAAAGALSSAAQQLQGGPHTGPLPRSTNALTLSIRFQWPGYGHNPFR